MRLYLVQHGDAVPQDSDRERPLSDQGRTDVDRMAALFGRCGLRIERVVHSGKLRARQTAEALATAVGSASGTEAQAGLEPNDPVAPWEKEAATAEADQMLVGHMPFMAKLAATLLGQNEERNPVSFRPGSVLCLERQDDGTWTIAWMIRPEIVV